jgi:hypothetical protein
MLHLPELRSADATAFSSSAANTRSSKRVATQPSLEATSASAPVSSRDSAQTPMSFLLGAAMTASMLATCT